MTTFLPRFTVLAVTGILMALPLWKGVVLAQDPTGGQSGTLPITPASKTSDIKFSNVPVNTILDLYEQLSGKNLVRDNHLSSLPPMSINAPGLDKESALKLISSFLLLNGVALIPIDDQTMKVVTVGTTINPRSESLPFYTKASDLPKEEQIVTYYMQMDHIDPQEAVGIFAQNSPAHTYGVYVPAPSSQGVVLTENVSVIRKLIQLKDSIDVARASNLPPARNPKGPNDSSKPGAIAPPGTIVLSQNEMILWMIVNFLVVVIVSYWMSTRNRK